MRHPDIDHGSREGPAPVNAKPCVSRVPKRTSAATASARLRGPESAANTELSASELAFLRSRLMRHARLLLSDRDAAEDLVQETLIAVVRGWSNCRGEACLTTWATAILRNKAADWHRSPHRRLVTGLEEAGEDSASETCTPEGGSDDHALSHAAFFAPPDRVLEQRELASAIDACIEQLSARSRQVFTMRERLGFETDEVCQRLGITQDHCRMLLHRARTSLRGQLLEMSLVP
jgi:RNA polymerase sigma-70 factor (ECF subfamily)